MRESVPGMEGREVSMLGARVGAINASVVDGASIGRLESFVRVHGYAGASGPGGLRPREVVQVGLPVPSSGA